MAAETHVNDGGTWRKLSEIHVNDGGTWRAIQEAYVNDGGTWRSVFLAESIQIVDQLVMGNALTGSPALALYELQSDGDIVSNSTGPGIIDLGDWITPKINMANYECRATVTSGSLDSGTTGTWMALSSTRSWSITRTSGQQSCVFTLEIRRAADSVVVDTATITLQSNHF